MTPNCLRIDSTLDPASTHSCKPSHSINDPEPLVLINDDACIVYKGERSQAGNDLKYMFSLAKEKQFDSGDHPKHT